MEAGPQEGSRRFSRLLPCYLKAADDGLVHDSVMLCEVIGDEIQSISLRVAADSIRRFFEADVQGGENFAS